MARLTPAQLKERYADIRKATGAGRENVGTAEARRARDRLSEFNKAQKNTSKSSSGRRSTRSEGVEIEGVEDAQARQSREVQQSRELVPQSQEANISVEKSTYIVRAEGGGTRRLSSSGRSYAEAPVITRSSRPETDANISTPQGSQYAPPPDLRRAEPESRISNVFRVQGQRSYRLANEEFGAAGLSFQRGDIAGAVGGGLRGLGRTAQTAVFGVSRTVTGLTEFGLDVLTRPRDTGAQIVSGSVLLATSAPARRATFQTVRSNVFADPVGAVAGAYTDLVVAPAAASRLVRVGKNVYVSGGEYLGSFGGREIRLARSSRYVPTESVFDASSTTRSGGAYTPSAGLRDSLQSFRAGRFVDVTPDVPARVPSPVRSPVPRSRDLYGGIVVQTSAPRPLAGGVSGVGKKAAPGIEDPGIYVNPQGRGSAAPLRLQSGSSYSLNPQSALQSLRGVPTVTTFRTRGITQYPRSVIGTPGFTAVSAFQQSVAGEGVAIITKRSELAFGSVPRQTYFNPVLGRTMREGATSELEAVIPIGTRFEALPSRSTLGRLRGFERYTTFEGRAVAIRDARLIYEGPSARATSFLDDSRIVPGERLAREQSSLSRQLSGTTTPYPASASLASGLVFSRSQAPASSLGSVSSSLPGSFISSAPVSTSSGSPGSSRAGSSPGSLFSRGSVSRSPISSSAFSTPSSFGASSIGLTIITSTPASRSPRLDSGRRQQQRGFSADVETVGFTPEYFGDVTATALGEFGSVPKGFRSGLVGRPLRRS